MDWTYWDGLQNGTVMLSAIMPVQGIKEPQMWPSHTPAQCHDIRGMNPCPAQQSGLEGAPAPAGSSSSSSSTRQHDRPGFSKLLYIPFIME